MPAPRTQTPGRPRAPLLVPGTHLLLRGRDHLQAGLDPDRSRVLARPPGDPMADPAVVDALGRAGLLMEHDLRGDLPGCGLGRDWERHALAALAARTPADVGAALAGRDGHEVHLHRRGHPHAAALRDDLAALLDRSGLARRPARTAGPRPGPRRTRTPVHVLVCVGEPDREVADGWLRAGAAHLLVRLTEARAVVGPFVDPGRTACLRCLDAHRTDADPAWPLLVEQQVRATRRDRADGMPEPVDPALAAVALGWAARDLATFVEGGTPVTLSATVSLPADLGTVDRHAWPAHPDCGCPAGVGTRRHNGGCA